MHDFIRLSQSKHSSATKPYEAAVLTLSCHLAPLLVLLSY
jgi:hypothetical protein